MSEKFIWPPGPPPSPPLTPARAQPLSREQSRVRSAVIEFERTWLGLRTPPIDIRIAESAWMPDDPHQYCQRCGSTVGPAEADDTGCSACRGTKVLWSRIVRLGSFESLLREMVHEVKFTRWRALGMELGRLLGHATLRALEVEGLPAERAVLVPVPTSSVHRIARGIDHALVIARGAREATCIPIVQALTRRHSPSQSGLSASQRRTNIRGVFRRKRSTDLSGRLAVLIDDVTTTRATLRACAMALSGEGAPDRMWAAVLGVTPREATDT